MASVKEELRCIIAKARDELSTIEAAEAEERNAGLLGKCYKFRNSFSCPRSDADYWWLYARVTTVEGHNVSGVQFECEKDGSIVIRRDAYLGILSFHACAYIEISEAEFRAAWVALCKQMMEVETIAEA